MMFSVPLTAFAATQTGTQSTNAITAQSLVDPATNLTYTINTSDGGGYVEREFILMVMWGLQVQLLYPQLLTV